MTVAYPDTYHAVGVEETAKLLADRTIPGKDVRSIKEFIRLYGTDANNMIRLMTKQLMLRNSEGIMLMCNLLGGRHDSMFTTIQFVSMDSANVTFWFTKTELNGPTQVSFAEGFSFEAMQSRQTAEV